MIHHSVGAGTTIVLSIIATCWLIRLADVFLADGILQEAGIFPRSLPHLPGIANIVVLHVDWPHILGNSVGLLVLGLMIAGVDARSVLVSTVTSVTVGGVGVWMFGRPAVHVGASGLVYGFAGFLLAAGYYNDLYVGVGFVAFVFFAHRIIPGLMPTRSDVSWEGHLFGLLGGIIGAAWLKPLMKALRADALCHWLDRHPLTLIWLVLTLAAIASILLSLMLQKEEDDSLLPPVPGRRPCRRRSSLRGARVPLHWAAQPPGG